MGFHFKRERQNDNDKLHRNKFEIRLNGNYTQDEEIDEKMLFEVLDHIAYGDDLDQISLVSNRIKENVLLENKPELRNCILNVLKSQEWINMKSPDLTARPAICILCFALSCQHIEDINITENEDILERAMAKCIHPREDDDFLNSCLNCIVEASKTLQDQNENDSILVLWDTTDTAAFHTWVIDINLEYGLVN